MSNQWEYLMVEDTLDLKNGYKGVVYGDWCLNSVMIEASHLKHEDVKEYKVHTIPGLLHDLGDDGWEMCGINQRETNSWTTTRYFFKRLLPGAKARSEK